MTKNINGDIYSDLITSSDSRPMAAGSIPRQKIDRIVIHHNATTNKNVAINTWLAGGAAQTSAHYEVADNEIIGTVGENVSAWHSGNYDMNARSIGIEHKNATGAPTWTISEATYASSAKLIADICKRYGFKPDATHIIPHKQVHATACPGGINMSKLIKMAQKVYTGGKVSEGSSKPALKPSSAIQQFKNAGNAFTATKPFTLDKIAFVNDMWQGISYKMAGSKTGWSWTLNGIPLAILDNKTRGNQADSHVGDKFTFMKGFNEGTIDEYDQKSNGVGIVMGGYGMIWFDANALLDL